MQEPRPVAVTVARGDLRDILPLRQLFLQESNFQIRYDAYHARGWTDSYLLRTGDSVVGYGAIKGQERDSRDTVFEFFVVPPFRKNASALFRQLLADAVRNSLNAKAMTCCFPR